MLITATLTFAWLTAPGHSASQRSTKTAPQLAPKPHTQTNHGPHGWVVAVVTIGALAICAVLGTIVTRNQPHR
jgi:hypothetical protein